MDRIYAGAALLLAVWSILIGIAAGVGDDAGSNLWSFLSLIGVAIYIGLRIERRRRVLGVLLVVLLGTVISALTFGVFGIPVLVGLALVVTCFMRVRRANRPT